MERAGLSDFFLRGRRPPRSTHFPYTTLFRSEGRLRCRFGQVDLHEAGRLGRHRKAFKGLDNAGIAVRVDRKSTRLNSSHANISYAVFCLKKKNPNKLSRLFARGTPLSADQPE